MKVSLVDNVLKGVSFGVQFAAVGPNLISEALAGLENLDPVFFEKADDVGDSGLNGSKGRRMDLESGSGPISAALVL